MTDALMQWAIRHHVSLPALEELRGMLRTQASEPRGASEARVASAMQLDASERGDVVLWRNNVGALKDERGRLVRFGLANETKALNERIKSADYIGIHRRVVTLEDVGRVIGQFVSIETKAEGWKYTGSAREKAQMAWAAGVAAWGGISHIHASATSSAFAQLPIGATR